MPEKKPLYDPRTAEQKAKEREAKKASAPKPKKAG